jgi:transposase
MSYKRGHRYLLVAVDHDSGRLIWAAAGRDKKGSPDTSVGDLSC